MGMQQAGNAGDDEEQDTCKAGRQTNGRLPIRQTDGRTNRRTTHRHPDRQAEPQTDGQAGRQADRQESDTYRVIQCKLRSLIQEGNEGFTSCRRSCRSVL